mmetsp:Transcript_10335/g.30457  ORF Transcript_10335/g.30457 Transcript_10335/m.30457 type:complete len:508 (-) Transcript_10335:140-1663(-)|eukprot:CAMPEP_0113547558 /NCGR_PEP_ID=MMETSP0015_2-20120614/12423_1 /TAXON_ID=2838 /ORGANISM="Odontella" /LENGTH=507 /DNA_ID=CAMNT_0000448127 /DNA_START=179 /DNA_END=1702 /DNA_ORIENTATION=- /assembly_acc=CAM_ASM_000160
MAGRKKRHSSGKKKKSNKARAPPPDVATVLARADEAANASDMQTALSLYTYASNQIRERIEGSSGPAEAATAEASSSNGGLGGGGTDESNRADVLLLSKTLGKCGETRVSLGDQEGGREAFLDAISILGNGWGGEDSMDEDRPPDIEVKGGYVVADAQFREAKAGLHLYLGQLSEAEEALSHYKLGVAELRKCLDILEAVMSTCDEGPGSAEIMEADSEPDTLKVALLGTRRQVCGAHCSIAELYLTDLCYDPEAEKQCEVSLQAALDLDDAEGAPDALQGMANLRLSQGRGPEATRHILDAYSRIKVGCEAMADLVGLGKDSGEESKDDVDNVDEKAKELVEVDAANSLPGFEFRCQTAKILLECSANLNDSAETIDNSIDLSKEREQGSFCAEAAVQVLGSLLAENDEVVEVWYLLGCAFASSSPPNNDLSRYYWERSHEMLKVVKESLSQEIAAAPDKLRDDEELIGQMKTTDGQIEEVEEKLAGLGNQKQEGSSTNDSMMEVS